MNFPIEGQIKDCLISYIELISPFCKSKNCDQLYKDLTHNSRVGGPKIPGSPWFLCHWKEEPFGTAQQRCDVCGECVLYKFNNTLPVDLGGPDESFTWSRVKLRNRASYIATCRKDTLKNVRKSKEESCYIFNKRTKMVSFL